MSINSADIWICATAMAGNSSSSEAFARAVVARAYYAAYHDCVTWHANLPQKGLLPSPVGGLHAQLAARLLNPDPALSSELALASIQRGQKLKSLHADRVVADYRLAACVDDADSIAALDAAKEIMAIS